MGRHQHGILMHGSGWRIKGQWITTKNLETHTFDLPYISPYQLLTYLFIIISVIGGIREWTVSR